MLHTRQKQQFRSKLICWSAVPRIEHTKDKWATYKYSAKWTTQLNFLDGHNLVKYNWILQQQMHFSSTKHRSSETHPYMYTPFSSVYLKNPLKIFKCFFYMGTHAPNGIWLNSFCWNYENKINFMLRKMHIS